MADYKKGSRSETKQSKQRWVNQHLFEDFGQNERKRNSENKENEWNSSNVPNECDPLLDSQKHFNKRELKSV